MEKYQFGEFIYQKRKQLHLTQDELGRKLGVTNKAVSKWETGETFPDIQLLAPLAKELNVTVDELLTQQKPPVEKVYVANKKPYALVLGLVFVILALVIALIITNSKLKEASQVESAPTIKDLNMLVDINPCIRSDVDGTKLSIECSVKNHSEEEISLTAVFTIKYYYRNQNDEVCIITYVRELYYDGETEYYIFDLRPKSAIDFAEFLSFEIDYEIVDFSM